MDSTPAPGFQLTTTATRGRDPRLPDPHAGRYESVLGVQRNLTRLLASSSVASVIVTPEREAVAGEAGTRPSIGDGSVVITWRRKVASGVDTSSHTCSVEMVPAELSLALSSPSTLSVEVGIPARIAVLGGGGGAASAPTPSAPTPSAPTPSAPPPSALAAGTPSAPGAAPGLADALTPTPDAGTPETGTPEIGAVGAGAPEGGGSAADAQAARVLMEARAAERLAQLRASMRPPS